MNEILPGVSAYSVVCDLLAENIELRKELDEVHDTVQKVVGDAIAGIDKTIESVKRNDAANSAKMESLQAEVESLNTERWEDLDKIQELREEIARKEKVIQDFKDRNRKWVKLLETSTHDYDTLWNSTNAECKRAMGEGYTAGQRDTLQDVRWSLVQALQSADGLETSDAFRNAIIRLGFKPSYTIECRYKPTHRLYSKSLGWRKVTFPEASDSIQDLTADMECRRSAFPGLEYRIAMEIV
jgi:membrane-associated HD superfamily phosphohydrolase